MSQTVSPIPSLPISRGAVDWRGIAHNPLLQAQGVLRVGYAVLPVIAGLDKFAHVLVDWDKYLAPQIATMFHGTHGFMSFVGVVEIIAGIGVAIMPRVFGYVVMAWLLGIVVNLLMLGGYYDVALRDFGLAIGAFALARLSADARSAT
jgi:hypothetical protein